MDLERTRYPLGTSLLAGGEGALTKILVTDGLLTGDDTSDGLCRRAASPLSRGLLSLELLEQVGHSEWEQSAHGLGRRRRWIPPATEAKDIWIVSPIDQGAEGLDGQLAVRPLGAADL